MKIKVSILWVPFLPIFYVTHLYKVLFFLFLLMSIHEMMHIVCAIQLRYKIEKVIVYPFGLSATIQDFEYKNSWHELCITLSGLGVHILAAFFMPALSFFFMFPYLFYLICKMRIFPYCCLMLYQFILWMEEESFAIY